MAAKLAFQILLESDIVYDVIISNDDITAE